MSICLIWRGCVSFRFRFFESSTSGWNVITWNSYGRDTLLSRTEINVRKPQMASSRDEANGESWRTAQIYERHNTPKYTAWNGKKNAKSYYVRARRENKKPVRWFIFIGRFTWTVETIRKSEMQKNNKYIIIIIKSVVKTAKTIRPTIFGNTRTITIRMIGLGALYVRDFGLINQSHQSSQYSG